MQPIPSSIGSVVPPSPLAFYPGMLPTSASLVNLFKQSYVQHFKPNVETNPPEREFHSAKFRIFATDTTHLRPLMRGDEVIYTLPDGEYHDDIVLYTQKMDEDFAFICVACYCHCKLDCPETYAAKTIPSLNFTYILVVARQDCDVPFPPELCFDALVAIQNRSDNSFEDIRHAALFDLKQQMILNK